MNAKRKEISEDQFEDYLNDCYGMVDVCGLEHDAGSLLRQIDPIAFRTALNDYEGSGDNDIWICCGCGQKYDKEEDAEECCRMTEKYF